MGAALDQRAADQAVVREFIENDQNGTPTEAQREGVLQIGSPLADFVQRQATAGRIPVASADALPLSAGEALRWLDSLAVAAECAAVHRALVAKAG